MLSVVSMVLVQNRNRRRGLRRTLQIAEMMETGDAKVLMQLDVSKDKLVKLNESVRMMKTLNLYTGMTAAEVKRDLAEKEAILRWLVRKNIDDVHKIGLIVAKYYSGKLRI
jgi:hypothetical protein